MNRFCHPGFAIISLIIIICIPLRINAQDILQLEKQADGYAEKSFTHGKALKEYLHCFRISQSVEEQRRFILKSSTVLASKTTLMAPDAATVDTLIEESRGKFRNDTSSFLPLIEFRIITSSNFAGKYQQEFLLLEEALDIRKKNNFVSGERYEQLLRKCTGISVYNKGLGEEQKQALYDELWRVYTQNQKGTDAFDIKLATSYARQCASNNAPEKAAEVAEAILKYSGKNGKENEEYIQALSQLCNYLSAIYRKTHGNNSPVLTEVKKREMSSRMELIELKYNTGSEITSLEIETAINCLTKFGEDSASALHMAELYAKQAELLHGKDSEQYADALDKLADASSGETRFNYRIEKLETFTRIGIPWKELDIRKAVMEVMDSKSSEIDRVKAVSFAKQYLQQTESNEGKETEDYCNALLILADAYGEDEGAVPYLEEALAHEENIHGKGSVYYSAVQMRLFSLNNKLHRQEAAISSLSKNEDEQNSSTLMLMGTQQVQYGQYREAIETYDRLLKQYASRQIWIANSQFFDAETIRQLTASYFFTATLGTINCYNKLKDISGMLTFGKKWCYADQLSEEERWFVFKNVSAMASNYGNSRQEVVDFIDIYSKAHVNAALPDMAEITILKAGAYLGMLRFDDASSIIDNLVKLLKESGAEPAFQAKYIIYQEICAMAQASIRLGDSETLDKAIQLNNEALGQMKQIIGYKQLAEYRSLCCRAALYQDLKSNYPDVLRLCREIDAFDMNHVTMLAPDESFNAGIFTILSTMLDESVVETPRFSALFHEGMKEESKQRMFPLVDQKTDLLRFTLEQLDNSMLENTLSWTSQFNDAICNVVDMTDDQSLVEKLFDYTMLYKQSSLAATETMRRQILESDNPSVISKFLELQQLKQSLSQQGGVAGIGIEQNLKQRITELERQLVEDSKMFGDFTKDIHLTWQDVQKALQPHEAIIEFVSFKSYSDKAQHLGALILKPDWSSPRFVQLPYLEDFDNAEALYWKKLIPLIGSSNTIYFSPAGEIYMLPMESSNNPFQPGLISDSFKLYRISSSRELLHKRWKGNIPGMNAAIYGGIEYNAPIEDVVLDSMQYPELISNGHRDATDNNKLRSARSVVSFLPGTKNEATKIAELFTKGGNGFKANLRTGVEGSEASFKALSGQDFNIIHVATHGVYSPLNAYSEYAHFFQMGETEDEILERSGLLFSGANHALKGGIIPANVDDGILSSMEISTLDLHDVTLVVLSACDTGNGDITSDGVFGLQRGFKKAGVQSILMSLWDVDDDATCFLMSAFYQYLISGKSKHEALELAKQDVRSTPGWEDSQYWAAFVLLDAFD